MIIKEWETEEQPREKLFLKGSGALSDAELLAIIIGSGSHNETALMISRRILRKAADNLNNLSKLGVNELKKFKGIGKVKALTILAAMELGKRQLYRKKVEQEKLSSSITVYEIMQPVLGSLEHEEFWVLLLNNANTLKYKWCLSMGGITATLVDIRLIFKKALEFGATSIILCHNHPSGNLVPSSSDISLTNKVVKAGGLLDIKVLDHVIITEASFYSFADQGKL
ncbi:RadC family protein [Lutimonas sp.]|uniref:RadC family protein n=1 Tax=Lutimonas sp. TaxID=1872403 RepID=UPI003D9AC134